MVDSSAHSHTTVHAHAHAMAHHARRTGSAPLPLPVPPTSPGHILFVRLLKLAVQWCPARGLLYLSALPLQATTCARLMEVRLQRCCLDEQLLKQLQVCVGGV